MADNLLMTNRRHFIAGAAAASLLVPVALKARSRIQEAAAPADLGAFVRVDPDDTVTVMIKHIEFGQGPMTGLTTLVADEMDADWAQMRAETAPANAALYGNSSLGGIQGTGGSSAIASSWAPMRKAGAQARAVLLAAAAQDWGVPVSELTVENGRIRHEGSGQEAGFGAFVGTASTLELPENPPMKTAAQRTLIGRHVPKIDTVAKTTGEAIYGQDTFRDGMLVVAVLHPPAFGATLTSVDDAAALEVSGVRVVKQIPQGVAVYADNTYAAFKGRAALKAEWDMSSAETRSSAQITADYEELANSGPGVEATNDGDVEAGLSEAATRVEAVYHFPFLAHTPMEPMNSVLEYTDEGAEVWMGSQIQTLDQSAIARILGIENPAQVKINTLLAGGSFGRLGSATAHFATEAATVLKESPDRSPVKLVWSREDDVRGGYYRPLAVHRVSAGLDAEGNITGWDQTIACPSLMAGTPFAAMIPEGGVDPTIVEGVDEPPYAVENYRVTAHVPETKVPVSFWRSVGHTHTAYVLETMIDELLEKGGKDPVEGRLAMMGEYPREAAVLRRVAEMADWGAHPMEGHARGVAVHKSFSSYVAEIVDLSLDGTEPRVHKVWCAVDCGVAVNPNVITAQMESCIGFGIGAALYDAITLGEGGMVQQANWDTYRMLRMREMPEVEVAIVDSQEDPTGVGEPGLPPVAPAMGNAIRQLTGETPRRLPVVTPVGV